MTATNNIPDHVTADRVFAFDLYDDPRLRDELHDGFARIIDDAPEGVFWTPLNGGHWVITRMEPAEEILKDHAFFSASEMEIPRIERPIKLIPLNLDPPASLPYRHILMPYFSPKAVAAREPGMRAWARHFVEQVAARGECDFLDAVASRFPVTIFMEMMGIPFERFDRFREMADHFFKDIPEAERLALAGEIIGDMMQLIEARRIERRDDIISVLLDARIDGRPLAGEEIQSMCFLLFLAGLDTVVNVMTFAWRALAADPGLQARLAADPSKIPGFVEEGLRLFGVVNVPRMVVRDTERFGVTFKAGDMVLCLNPQFGRDEQQNADAKTIDVDRQNRRLLPFSIGPHLCLGHNLARMEMRILAEEWVKAVPSFGVADDYVPSFRAGMVMSLKSLALRWPVAASAAA
ncbi:MAG: cytochrome P450 [Caulobacter sp.]|nr:cytochrome P450 [Caulobacter sp.]